MSKRKAEDKADKTVVDLELAKRVLRVVDKGLTEGIGEPRPGRMCVEAAVCHALGLPHDDSPPCVGNYVIGTKIDLNDMGWSSKAARARGLRKIAIAQLGSNKINQGTFRAVMYKLITQRLTSRLLKAYSDFSKKLSDGDRAKLVELADACALDGWKIARRKALNVLNKYALDNSDWSVPIEVEARFVRTAIIRNTYTMSDILLRLGDLLPDSGRKPARKPAENDRDLIVGAEIILDALIECGSPGVLLLDELSAAGALGS